MYLYFFSLPLLLPEYIQKKLKSVYLCSQWVSLSSGIMVIL